MVTIPSPQGAKGPSAPTGQVFNNTTEFKLPPTNQISRFIFATEDGTISAWASGTNALLMVDNSASGAIYKGLAMATNNGGAYLYAANFSKGTVDIFDGTFKPISWEGAFVDSSIPAGFAPFNIRNFGGLLYVAYAHQDADKHDDESGPGSGYVNVFAPNGEWIARLISQGPLNSPWGLAIAPVGFTPFGGKLLVGNFGDGVINAFDPATGVWLGPVKDSQGSPISIPGLWALQFGNGGRGGATNVLYFTAGIPGTDHLEDHGLFGSIAPVYPTAFENCFSQHNLVSDLPGVADLTDTNLANPWGIATSVTSPFWISDNHTGLTTLYNSTGAIQSLVVSIPSAKLVQPPSSPTGQLFNSTTAFQLPPTNQPARFIFCTEDGTVSAWAAGTNAFLMADNSAAGSVYKGIALGQVSGRPYLYAADFHNGKIDIFDGSFQQTNWAGAFVDSNLPVGFGPFNIQSFNGVLHVTYAKQNDEKHDDVSGSGNGFVDVFSMSGVLLRRLITQGPLNSPWGLAIAPAGFGPVAGALLVGNFGDGMINAFDWVTGTFLGPVRSTNGVPISIPGLWGLLPGNGGRGGETNSIYFTAGIPGGGNLEDHGLFGSLSPISFPHFTSEAIVDGQWKLTWSGGIPPIRLQGKSVLTTNAVWVDIPLSGNGNTSIPVNDSVGFYRLLDGSPQ